MRGSKISQLMLATWLSNEDLIPIVQDGENKKIDGLNLYGSIGTLFVSKGDFDISSGNYDAMLQDLRDSLLKQYVLLENRVDNSVDAFHSTMGSYYNLLDGSILDLRQFINQRVEDFGSTMQEWIGTIDGKATLNQIQDLINRLTINENLLTKLAEIVGTGGSGGGGGGIPGYHTQASSTITPLTGYYKTFNTEPLSVTDSLNQALGKLESKVDALSSGGGSGSMLPLIKTGETTLPTDGNLYTAAKTKEEFLSKKYDDTASGKITFLTGAQFGQVFSSGFMGTGGAIWRDGSNWNMEIDNLFVRKQMTVNELVVNQINAVGGEILVSVADGKAVSVIDAGNVFRVYLDPEKSNQFVALDQAICQKFDGKNVKRYWRLVTSVGEDKDGKYIELSKTDMESGSGPVEEGDVILQLGNRNNKSRQAAIFISAKDYTKGPNITMYDNITGYTLENKDRTSIGKESKFVGTIMQTTKTGDIIPLALDRGLYIPGRTYYYYDRVSYDGSLWLCMAVSTQEVPSLEKPYVWQIQVQKGDDGRSGEDGARWTKIHGPNLFLYNGPSYEGTPDPISITQTCTIYNLTNVSYEWKIMETQSVLSTMNVCTLLPDVFPDNVNQLRLRCTVKSTEGTFYDETQIARLYKGGTGDNALYMDLSNPNIAVPYDSSGNNPLINLDEIECLVNLYSGIENVEYENLRVELESGDAVVDIKGNRIQLVSFKSGTARFKVLLDYMGVTVDKTLWLVKVSNGIDGKDGIDSSYVMVSGEQVFKMDGTASTPSEIRLEASTQHMVMPTFKWEWSVSGENLWTIIETASENWITIGPNDFGFSNPMIGQIAFKCTATPQFSDNSYSDIITVTKLRDGIDGDGAYRAILSNENQTIPSDYAGNVQDAYLNLLKTEFKLFLGTNEMSYGSEYNIRVIQPIAGNTSKASINSADKTVNVTALDTNYDISVFKVEFLVLSKVVEVKDFTISKAKGAAPADYNVDIFAYSLSEPATPKFKDIPGSVGMDGGDGTIWYLEVPSGDVIWRSVGSFLGTTDTIDKSGWSKPVLISGIKGEDGKDGVDGAQGPQGRPGYNGTDGRDGVLGPIGPNTVFRGSFEQHTTYYSTSKRRDVVKYGNYYYACLTTTSSSPGLNPDAWEMWNSFENIATGFLFAEEATISGWVFKDSFIMSPSGEFALSGTPGHSTYPMMVMGSAGTPGAAVIRNQMNPDAALRFFKGGTITAGWGDNNSRGEGYVGITGAGDSNSAVRIWAGKKWEDREAAPFRVLQDGTVFMSKAKVQTSADGRRVVMDPADGSIICYSSSNAQAVKIFHDISSNHGSVIVGRNSMNNLGFRSESSKGLFLADADSLLIRSSINSSVLTAFSVTASFSKLKLKLVNLPLRIADAGANEVYSDNGTLKIKLSQ